jgi:hypothetical protein
VTGAALRAALCDVMPSVRVHGASLDEWGAMEEGTNRDAYVRGMRDEGTWGGGIEIAALAAALRAPIVVHFGASRTIFGGEYDGDELGGGECSLFFCGPDPDRMLAVLLPLLKRSPLARGAHVVRMVDGAPRRAPL